MLFNNSHDKRTSLGLLLQRVGLSAMLLIHCVPKLIAGSAQWSAAAKLLSILKLGLPEQFTGLVILIGHFVYS